MLYGVENRIRRVTGERIMDQELLSSIWERLNRPPPRWRNVAGATKITTDIARSGRCRRVDLEDMLEAFDGRLYDLDVWALADYLDAPRRTVFPKPRSMTAANMGSEAITAADAAGILIFLEQIGFEVEPSILVDTVLPRLENKANLTGCELDILRYPTQNGRHYIEIRCQSRGAGRLDEQSLRTARGIRIRAILANGQPYVVRVKGPRYKSRPLPRTHHCDYCGLDYMRGDPEESLAHRSYHAKIRQVVDPQPKRPFVEALETDLDAELVRARSPMWKHDEMFARARQFKREMGFDFIQWGHETRRDTDPQVHGFLLADTSGTLPHGSIVGACCFRWRDDHWSLSWVWIAPKMRRNGILAQRWPGFLERFGDFAVEAPLSDAMQLFLARHGTPAQRAYLIPSEAPTD